MLLNGGDFRIHRLDAGAWVGSLAHFDRVALQCAVDEGGGHTRNIICGFGVGEGLIRRCLLKTFYVAELS